ncbi:MAG TPA: ribosome maturation factor RimM [Gammaproteobacteria bacterium]|jgi:16S rRNA processing protein RimM|nr:ribosome maturation factor RimM [Gammaproteobacteria bacterium]
MAGQPVVLGRLSGLYGVRGAFKVFSYTDPREAICDYADWLVRRDDEWRPHRLIEGRRHGRTVVARLEGVENRDAAAALLGAEVGVLREALPTPAPGEYYWADLVGLDVVTTGGTSLGRVERLFDTGANDVMVVAGERERWLPFLADAVVRNVDFAAGVIEVDWDPEW